MKQLKMSVCEGRHSISNAVDGSIFGETITDAFNWYKMDQVIHAKLKACSRLDLYVTGFTPATLAIINYCLVNLIPLTCWHYDLKSGEYVPQVIETTCHASLLREAGYIK